MFVCLTTVRACTAISAVPNSTICAIANAVVDESLGPSVESPGSIFQSSSDSDGGATRLVAMGTSADLGDTSGPTSSAQPQLIPLPSSSTSFAPPLSAPDQSALLLSTLVPTMSAALLSTPVPATSAACRRFQFRRPQFRRPNLRRPLLPGHLPLLCRRLLDRGPIADATNLITSVGADSKGRTEIRIISPRR